MGEGDLFIEYITLTALVMIFFIMCPTVNATCPSECICISQEKAVPASYCNNRKLTVVPKNIAKNTEILSLRLNNLKKITDDDFAGLHNLRQLNLVFNGIQHISDNAFKDLTKLQSLNLGYNGIKQLPTNAFRNLLSLEELFINNNLLVTLPKGIFSFLPNLKRISLQSNQIIRDSNEAFANLDGLEKLNLAHNKIDVITSHMLQNSKKLKYLYMDDNKIKKIDSNAFKSLDELKEVYLDNNALITVSENLFKNKSSLSRISLYNNPLQCDCNLFWIHNALNARAPTFQHAENMVCQSPLTSEGTPISALSRHNFNCYGSWESWTTWNECEKPCSGGLRHRSRICNTNARSGIASSCRGDETQSEACNTFPCSNGVATSWSGWSACSVSCNEGAQRRARRCINPYTGAETASCNGPLSEMKVCIEKQCAVDGSWSEWTSWSSCNETCGYGMSSRERSCTNPLPRFGGALCDGSHTQTQNKVCVAAVCSPRTSWGSWSDFSKCSVSCGDGKKVRTRSCLNEFNKTIQILNICPGSPIDIHPCNGSSFSCKQDGEWSSWLPWSQCIPMSCKRYRSRTCTKPAPMVGGRTCPGHAREDEACDPRYCVVHAIWSQWQSWSFCSKSCGGGSRSRTRKCPGEQYRQVTCGTKRWQTGTCNEKPCQKSTWSNWGKWSKCIVKSKKDSTNGRRVRKRECIMVDGIKCEGGSSREKVPCTAAVTVITKPDECKPRGDIRNGQETYSRIGNSIVARYKCDKYYKLKGAPSEITCVKGRGWSSPNSPYCAPICGRPEHKSRNHWTKWARLLNGEFTLPHSWPWQVAIEVKSPTSGWKLRCGGNLLNDKWVLTAGHCLYERTTNLLHKASDIRVFLGVHNLTERYKNKEIQKFTGKSVHPYEGFDHRSLHNDIGLIELKGRAKFSDKVLPVCLPTKKQRNLAATGKVGTVVGWGLTQELKASEVLQELKLPVVARKDCLSAFHNDHIVTNSMFCAGMKDTSDDTCKGDSGGGYSFLDSTKKHSKWTLQGIVSWGGMKCGQKGKYSVFTRVHKFTKWIKKKMRDVLIAGRSSKRKRTGGTK